MCEFGKITDAARRQTGVSDQPVSLAPSTPGWLKDDGDGKHLVLRLGGDWTLAAASTLDRACNNLVARQPRADLAQVDLSRIERLDTAGAWLIARSIRALVGDGTQPAISGGRPEHLRLLGRVSQLDCEPIDEPSVNPLIRLIEELGRGTVAVFDEGRQLLNFFGATCVTLGSAFVAPHRVRLTPLFAHMEQTGLNALPIIGLLSFLIGVVMAYQGADQLRYFGAEIFTVNLLGLSILRELGVLMTAIIIAGRSGSAFTAQIGTMKVNEEIDAMRTLGLAPMEVLVLPRVLALMLTLPLLTFFANIMALLGGCIICNLILDIGVVQFLNQLRSAITPASFWIGIGKAPVFAFLIAMVGCYKGLRVEGGADSVGTMTTQSVVVAIFLVIVVDAAFSVLFSIIGI